ncbi:SpoIIE family protein phosphatase [Glaciimonas sp. PCH181]|uniref:SpoIIE family protein phosphatase n=1 Tax=Glaciimonas sp. PCH181 TaxID=2133943 RepID=UPI000D3ADE48|nr:SpoIIE family protein phosphatase [Glaciimonas sp. PCH181]PUA17785.1 protein-serine/threonine phosphatase [Glaciimonas sp. PCH181]
MKNGFISTPTKSPIVRHPSARDLSIVMPTISVDENNASVVEIFSQHRDLVSLVVLQQQRPMGLISRHIFMSQMSKPYHRELYEKKSCIAFMDKEPLIVEAETVIEKLALMAVEAGDKTLADGFIIISNGAFLGWGSGLDLMRMMVDLQSEKNRNIMQSIEYASVIQRAMLSTSRDNMSSALTDACLVWEPRDVVGGDFYHFTHFEGGWFAAVADCTGHGVPGAFLTLIASSTLAQALVQHGPQDPALLLSEVNRSIKQSLGQHTAADRLSESDDGMDATFFWFDTSTSILTSAGAKISLFVLMPEHDEVVMVDGERIGLGYVATPLNAHWSNSTTTLSRNTIVFAATDGIIDQIGGSRNIAFGKRRIRTAMLANRHLPMSAFAETLMGEQKAYQGAHLRRDDLTFFAFRVH